MDKKKILLLLLALALLGALAYSAWSEKPAPETQPTGWKPNEHTLPAPSLPASCVDQKEGVPVITSLSRYSGPVGTKLEVRGCNFSGFEGDKNVWIENAQGVKGIMYGEPGSTAKTITVTLSSPLCQEDESYTGLDCKKELTLMPGTYKLYVLPWDKESNKVDFAIQ